MLSIKHCNSENKNSLRTSNKNSFILQIKLEKQCDKMKASGAPFLEFIDRMDQWLVKNYSATAQLLKTVDADGEGYVTFEEFKSSMYL